jgi:tartrate dehydrogenase/decarboxylase/D-malate dehydrogenase
MGTLWAVNMMLDQLGEHALADALMDAMCAVLAGGKVRTPDIGGTSSTSEFGDAVCAALK